MSLADLNALWAAVFVDEAHRAGLRHVVVAPGSRSTPLVLAFARHGGYRLHRHLDERSAAFYALGMGKATGVPAAVLTTSGTATANLFPAVVEASRTGVPLLVLTADRPHRLRGSDANQTIDQVRLYGNHVRDFVDVMEPSVDDRALGRLRVVANRSVGRTMEAIPGPVHLNFPFDKPLEPDTNDLPSANGVAAIAQTRWDPAPAAADETLVQDLGALLERSLAPAQGTSGQKGAGGILVVAGPGPIPGAETLPSVVQALGGVLLPDPLSGARYGGAGSAPVVTHYDAILRDTGLQAALRPSVIFRLGGPPTSGTLLRVMQAWADVPQIMLGRDRRFEDHLGVASEAHAIDGVDLLSRLPLRESGAYSRLWERIEASVRSAAASISDRFLEGWAARAVAAVAPNRSVMFLSSSMPIRDMDAFAGPSKASVVALGNRGASGIDGVVSTALGAAVAADAPLACLIGDVAFIHDCNGFLTAGEVTQPAVFVVVDNDGGGIFQRLPVARFEPEFTEYFVTPHGLRLENVATLHGLSFERVTTAAKIRSAVAAGLARPGVSVVCVEVDRQEGHQVRRAAEEQLRLAAVSALTEN